MTTTLVLALLNGIGGYIVYSDASYKGLECVLMEHRQVIVYRSKQLKTHKRNYSTHDLEFVAIVYVLKL